MSDRIEQPEDDDTGSRITEEALAERADAAPLPAVQAVEGARIRDEDAALYHTGSDADVAFYSENNEREAAMWKGLMSDKRTLQREGGYGVWFVDAKGKFAGKRTQHIAVGKAAVTHAEFRAWAERTRRAAKAAA